MQDQSDPKTTPELKWELTSCQDGIHVDPAAASYMREVELAMEHQQRLLNAGWEPFAVDGGRMWFRRRVPGYGA